MAGVCTGPGPCDTHPTGHGGDNFVTRGGGFDPYLRAIINALKRKGRPESQAVQIAIGTVQRWARGEGNVTAATRARAAASLAHWEALKAKTHSLTAEPARTVDLAVDPTGHRYHHGWIRIDASTPTAVERATRAASTDGHALLHGPGMVPTAQRVIERMKAAGHTPTVSRIDVAGTPHLHVTRAATTTSLTATPSATVDLTFTEQLHPRGAKGASNGGKFVAKNNASAPPSNMAANVRDFQRRTGLPVTGVIDATTAAKLHAELTAKGGAGRKSSGKTKARKAAAAAKQQAKAATRAQKQQTATHVAMVNAMTPTQRAAARAQMPVPPTGYVWTAPANTLRRFHA